MRLLLASLALLLLVPAAAGAAWNGYTVSGPHASVDPLGLLVSGNGRALATWSFADAAGNASRLGASSATRPPGAAPFRPARPLVPRTRPDRRSTTVESVATFGAGRALLATTRQVGGAVPPATRLAVRFGGMDGRFGRPVAIRTRRGLQSVSLAVNVRGDAALAWFEDRGVRTDRVYVALRRAGRAFGPPRRLATGRIRGVAAAIGARGDALVSWDARGIVRTRFKPRGARDFQATDTIRSGPAFFADLRPVVTPSGRAVLAWSAQFASEGGSRGPIRYEAATRRTGARRFGRARLLERIPAAADDGLGRPVDALVDSAGAVAIAWRGAAGVRVKRGSRGAARIVSPRNTIAVLSDLAAGPGGRLIAVWDSGVDDTAGLVRSAVAPGANAPFGPPEDVSEMERDSRFGRAAFLGDRPAVVATSRPAPRGQSVARVYVR